MAALEYQQNTIVLSALLLISIALGASMSYVLVFPANAERRIERPGC